jgi:hypothetical protein
LTLTRSYLADDYGCTGCGKTAQRSNWCNGRVCVFEGFDSTE